MFGTEGREQLWRGWEGNEKLLSDKIIGPNPRTSRVWFQVEQVKEVVVADVECRVNQGSMNQNGRYTGCNLTPRYSGDTFAS